MLLCFYLFTDLNKAQTGQHTDNQLVATELQLPAEPSLPDKDTEEKPSSTTILVSGVPDSATKKHLEYYFQTPSAGGHKGSVVDCQLLQPGKAQITFCDSTGE